MQVLHDTMAASQGESVIVMRQDDYRRLSADTAILLWRMLQIVDYREVLIILLLAVGLSRVQPACFKTRNTLGLSNPDCR